MKNEKKKLYVGFALASSTDEFKSEALALIDELKKSYEVLGFYGGYERYEGDEEDIAVKIVEFDVGQIRKSDMVCAICSVPSTGLGYEICYALTLGKRVVAFGRNGEDISNMVTGIRHPKFSYHWVDHLDEVPEVLKGADV